MPGNSMDKFVVLRRIGGEGPKSEFVTFNSRMCESSMTHKRVLIMLEESIAVNSCLPS